MSSPLCQAHTNVAPLPPCTQTATPLCAKLTPTPPPYHHAFKPPHPFVPSSHRRRPLTTMHSHRHTPLCQAHTDTAPLPPCTQTATLFCAKLTPTPPPYHHALKPPHSFVPITQ
eukprot:625611-Pelagomonas_calceolata.AAC.3